MTERRRVRIVLKWLMPPPPDGQSSLAPFSIPTRFEHQDDNWRKDAWSLVITPEGIINDQGEQIGVARFLVDEAPHDWLVLGKRFTLVAGQVVAEGLVTAVLPD